MAGGSGPVSCAVPGAVGALEQPERLPTIDSMHAASRANAQRAILEPVVIHRSCCMALLLLEALLALVILIAIVWWTMFSGRHKGELKAPDARKSDDTDSTP
jgi:hypothetical protein